MSISNGAQIIVGLPREELTLSAKVIEEKIDDGKLEECPSYYDSYGADENIVGFVYKHADSPLIIGWNEEEISKLKDKFRKVTGQEPVIFLSPYSS